VSAPGSLSVAPASLDQSRVLRLSRMSINNIRSIKKHAPSTSIKVLHFFVDIRAYISDLGSETVFSRSSMVRCLTPGFRFASTLDADQKNIGLHKGDRIFCVVRKPKVGELIVYLRQSLDDPEDGRPPLATGCVTAIGVDGVVIVDGRDCIGPGEPIAVICPIVSGPPKPNVTAGYVWQ
jgi:hypothetical protein